MKQSIKISVMALVAMFAFSTVADAQFGGLLKAAKKAVSKKKDPSQEYYDQIKAENEKKAAEMEEFKKQEGIKAFDANAELPKSPVARTFFTLPGAGQKMMLDKVLHSNYYINYMDNDAYGIDIDANLWRDLFKNVIFPDPDMAEMVESKSLFWSIEDFDIMGQFVLKTIRRIEEGLPEPILPMFKDEEDRRFGESLFADTVSQMEQNNELIDTLVKSDRWDKDRIALMDRIIMCMALTEMQGYESIPTAVTLNEYIELAKNFSTTNSGHFVNGILNSAMRQLRSSGKIVKP